VFFKIIFTSSLAQSRAAYLNPYALPRALWGFRVKCVGAFISNYVLTCTGETTGYKDFIFI